LGSGCHAPQLSDRGLEQLDRIVLPKLLDQDGDSFPQDSINFSLIGHDGSVFRSTRVFLDLHSISTSLAFLSSALLHRVTTNFGIRRAHAKAPVDRRRPNNSTVRFA
jgi:hypothetical protein